MFVIVDFARDVPDPRHLEEELSGEQIIAGKRVNVKVLFAEP